MNGTNPSETALYAPVKSFLEAQGYCVKAEIMAADVVAVREGEDPVIVELKLGFSLALFHQGLARKTVTDAVYLAVVHKTGRAFARSVKDNCRLARHLGLGVLTVRLRDGLVLPHCDPGPFRPRKSARRRTLLLREFQRRSGDPNVGGSARGAIVTAYRQDALLCARHLDRAGPTKGAGVAAATGVVRATRLMADNHYGWFQRVSTGVYGLTPAGQQAARESGQKLG